MCPNNFIHSKEGLWLTIWQLSPPSHKVLHRLVFYCWLWFRTNDSQLVLGPFSRVEFYSGQILFKLSVTRVLACFTASFLGILLLFYEISIAISLRSLQTLARSSFSDEYCWGYFFMVAGGRNAVSSCVLAIKWDTIPSHECGFSPKRDVYICVCMCVCARTLLALKIYTHKLTLLASRMPLSPASMGCSADSLVTPNLLISGIFPIYYSLGINFQAALVPCVLVSPRSCSPWF